MRLSDTTIETAGQPRRRGRPRAGTAIGDRVLAMLACEGEMEHADIVSAFPTALPSSVSVALLRLCKGGHLEQPRRGIYRLAEGASSRAAGVDAAYAAVRAMPPGEAFDTGGLTFRAGVSYQGAQNAIARLLKSGSIVRQVRGVYVRAGAPPKPGGAPIPLYDEVLGIMGDAGRAWTASDIRARLSFPENPATAAHTLNNMYRAGLLVRADVGLYRLSAKGAARRAAGVALLARAA